MKIPDLSKEEAWVPGAGVLLPTGWHNVTIDRAAEGTSSGGYDQIELEMSNQQGTIRDWIVVIPATLGKVKSMVEATGLEIPEGDWDFDTSALRGRAVRILLGDEEYPEGSGEFKRRVQGYVPVSATSDVPGDDAGVPAAAGADDDIPF